MIPYHNLDPIAIHLPEFTIAGRHFAPAVHWYGLMYLIGFWGFWWLGTIRGKKPHVRWTSQQVSDLLFYGVFGVILGGRLGYTLFYNLEGFLADPLSIVRIWQGGMSFHGGLVGVIVAMIVFARQRGLSFWTVADFAAVLTPFGLMTGRIGNFINGELWGAVTTAPWGMVFPTGGPLPRHPSMLYEAFLEGVLMLAILWWFGSKPRPRAAISGLFLLLYGVFRFAVEFVRQPDAHLGYQLGTTWLTRGMELCVPMILFGIAFIVMAYRRRDHA